MSEIKGQILGIILTIGVFAAVFATLVGAFKATSGKVQERMENGLTYQYDETKDDDAPEYVTHDSLGA